MPLYTPLSGSWLNMAESVQRIIVRRALAGTYPQSSEQTIQALEATVRGGKGKARRDRARARRHAHRLGGSGGHHSAITIPYPDDPLENGGLEIRD